MLARAQECGRLILINAVLKRPQLSFGRYLSVDTELDSLFCPLYTQGFAEVLSSKVLIYKSTADLHNQTFTCCSARHAAAQTHCLPLTSSLATSRIMNLSLCTVQSYVFTVCDIGYA